MSSILGTPEILENIFSYLPTTSLVRLTYVNKLWRLEARTELFIIRNQLKVQYKAIKAKCAVAEKNYLEANELFYADPGNIDKYALAQRLEFKHAKLDDYKSYVHRDLINFEYFLVSCNAFFRSLAFSFFSLAIASSAGVFNLIDPSLDTKDFKMSTPVDRYYKYYSLSGVPSKLLKNEEHFNLHITPKKEKKSEQPKVKVLMKFGFPGKHRQQCFVEKTNQEIQRPILNRMTAQEMKTSITSVEWSEDYPILIEALREKWKRNPPPIPEGLPRITDKDELLQEGTRVRVMLFEPKSVLVRNYFRKEVKVLMKFGFPGKHRQQCFVEKTNQEIQRPILNRMTAQEMKTSITSVEWSEDYPILIEALREKWKRNPPPIPEGLPRITDKDELLQEGTRVRVMLFEPKSVLGKKLHEQPPTYLVNGPHGRLAVSHCAYTRKQLQVVPDNENPPPDSVICGKQDKFIPEKILKQRTYKGKKQYLVKWCRYPENESTWEPANRFKEDAPHLVNEFLEVSRA
ncbi:13101_t:CDS:2 [Entrophospora sp. SA101]|nr:13101_t:CDS:2 [Entrophospora sp. SA101]